MKENQKIWKCNHCSNETLMEIRTYHKKESGNFQDDNYFFDISIILFCPICSQFNLINAYWDHTYGINESNDKIYNNFNVEESSVYPELSTVIKKYDCYLPASINKLFSKAIELKMIDIDSCVIKLRKTLESICYDKKAKGNKLVDMIADLYNEGILPNTLNSASSLVRKLGNVGAHQIENEITHSEVALVIEFVEYIITYIYVLPNEVKKLESKFEKIEQKK